MRETLIFDVGVNDGSDSAYYLQQADKVVGVEANPIAADALRRRFAAEIADGRYVLVQAAIARSEGRAEFWICDSHPDWSSFDRSIASREGAACHAVEVETRRFDTILAEHGVPSFCKIDIEGSDSLCLEALRKDRKPAHLSIEMSHETGNQDLQRLYDLGYSRFKLVSQVTRAQPLRRLVRVTTRLPRRIRGRVLALEKIVRGISSDGTWTFNSGCSGSFGERGPGPWRSFQSVMQDWHLLHDLVEQRSHIGDWYDIHAAG